MTRPPTLTTPRLTLRPLAPADAAGLFSLYSHPEAMRFMDTPPHDSPDETRAQIETMLVQGSTAWTLNLPDAERAIGLVEYLGGTPIPGMGYILHPDFWGLGYMGEAVARTLAHGFAEMGLDRVELWIDARNRASIRLAERCGFTYRGSFRQKYRHHDSSHEKRVYGLHAAEWRGEPESPSSARTYGLEPVLPVADVVATAAFYRDRLGFRIDFLYGDPPVHGAVSLSEWTTGGARIQLSHEPEAARSDCPLALYLFVGPEIDELYRRYRQRGVAPVDDLGDRPWGMREFAVADCNGYILRFGTPA